MNFGVSIRDFSLFFVSLFFLVELICLCKGRGYLLLADAVPRTKRKWLQDFTVVVGEGWRSIGEPAFGHEALWLVKVLTRLEGCPLRDGGTGLLFKHAFVSLANRIVFGAKLMAFRRSPYLAWYKMAVNGFATLWHDSGQMRGYGGI